MYTIARSNCYKNPNLNNNINFKALYPDSAIKCDNYSGFRKNPIAIARANQVLGEQCSSVLKLKGITDFDTYFNLYGLGKLHLLLMPTREGDNNFVKSINRNSTLTMQAINSLAAIIKKTNPNDKQYLFEAGSGDDQIINNTKGIIPAHLHYISWNDIPADDLFKEYEQQSGNNVVRLKKTNLYEIYDFIKSQTADGKLGYNFIAKQTGPYNLDAAVVIQNNPSKRVSQFTSKTLSKIMYGSDHPDFYDWKKIDDDPKNWSDVLSARIKGCKETNLKFLHGLKKLGYI